MNYLINCSFNCIFFAQVIVSPQNVLSLDSTLNLSQQLADSLSNYKFIMLSEMHGTQEPVRLLRNMAVQLSTTKNISVGFEIPADQINLKSKKLNVAVLKKSRFFKNNKDGRSSEAWLNTIAELSGLNNCSVFFFDCTKSQAYIYRDSAMYLNLKTEFLKDSARIFLTISGNVHNQLLPYKESKTMGSFVLNNLSSSVLAVNHIYESGAMYNNIGKGAMVNEVNNKHEVLRSISKSPNYFYFDLHREFSKQWNAFLFTTKINPAFPVKNK